jgi:uncharacterized protein
MRPSYFNTFFDYDSKKIGYNSLSNEFIILEPVLHELYDAATKEKNLPELNEIHPEFYQFLIQKKFIVEDNLDEVAIVKQLQAKVDFDENNYVLVINPTMNCNFKCWYCYESHIKDSKMSAEIVTKVIKFSDKIIEQKKVKYFHLAWFGGEPLLYAEEVIFPILKELYHNFKSNGIEFSSSFTTNGLLINEHFIDYFKAHDANDFQITLDGDEQTHDTVRFVSKSRGSYRQILSNIKLLASRDCTVTVRINISDQTVAGLFNIADDFSSFGDELMKKITFSFQKVWQELKPIDAGIDASIAYFRRLGYKVNYIGGRADTVRNSCYADKKNQATINYNGDVFKCTARDFTSETKEGVIDIDGNLTWNELEQKRMSAKFQNKPCLRCKLLPICNGGCSQNALENEGRDYCVYDFDEQKKNDVIYHKFLENVIYA